jgi:hypothetical protein
MAPCQKTISPRRYSGVLTAILVPLFAEDRNKRGAERADGLLIHGLVDCSMY